MTDWTAYDARTLRGFLNSFLDAFEIFDTASRQFGGVCLYADQEVNFALCILGTVNALDDILSELRCQIVLINDALAETPEAKADARAEREAQEIGPI